MVDLASIVLGNPRLLLLDEPTAGIAQREAEAFIPLLQRLQQVADTTIVLVEHDVPARLRALHAAWWSWSWDGWWRTGRPTWCAPIPRALAAYLGASDEALLASGTDGTHRTERDARTDRTCPRAAGARRGRATAP